MPTELVVLRISFLLLWRYTVTRDIRMYIFFKFERYSVTRDFRRYTLDMSFLLLWRYTVTRDIRIYMFFLSLSVTPLHGFLEGIPWK